MADDPSRLAARNGSSAGEAGQRRRLLHPPDDLSERDRWNAPLDARRRRPSSAPPVRPEPGERVQRRRRTSGRRAIARRPLARSCSKSEDARKALDLAYADVAAGFRRSSSSEVPATGRSSLPATARARCTSSRLLHERGAAAQGPARRRLCRRLADQRHRRPARARPAGLHARRTRPAASCPG